MRWGRKKQEADLERELRSHLELEAEEQRESGLPPEEARYAAQRAFGNTTRVQEATREEWGHTWVDRLSQDLRYGCRTLKNNPGFSAVAILTAALGIGTNTSIFSIVNAVLLRPLPYPDAEQLVSPVNVAKDNFIGLNVADFQYAAWRDQAVIFNGIAAYTSRPFIMTGNGEPEQVKAQLVTPGFLRTMRVAPLLGRDFTPADAVPRRGGRVVLMSHALWTRRFSADPSILSRQITLNGDSYSVAAVLPQSFEFPENGETSLLIAISEPPAQPGNGIYFYSVIARMKRGVTTDRAQADLALINQRLEAAYPKKFGGSFAGLQTRVTGLHDRLVGKVRTALLVLSGAVALVLLIVCVNICNLLLARAVARQKEIAVRIALGAGQGRVFRQLLTEGMLLAAAGGVTGLALAYWGVKLLRGIAPAGVPHVENAHLSGGVLAFNIVIAALTGILFGLAPVRRASSIDPDAALKQTARSTTGTRKHRRMESLLIVSETAFALILLAGAGLLIRTFAGLTAIAPGFRPDNVLTARISLPYWKYRTADRQCAMLDMLMTKLQAGPGVSAVSAVSALPYGGFVMADTMQIAGRPASQSSPSEAAADQVVVNYAAGEYFKAMGIPILEGRAIDSSDRAGQPAVAVVNQTLARHFFPGTQVLGNRVRFPGFTGWLEIVGVSGDVKQGGLASEPRAEILQPAAQSESGGSAQTLAIRSSADLRILGPWLRSQIAEVDPDIPLPEIETMRSRMASLVASQLFVMRLLALFAGVAIALAAIGIYSVLVYSVQQRTHEIGIRMALGAKRAHIMGLIVGRGLRLSIGGAVMGTAGGLMLTRYLETLLYGVTPHDPSTLAAGCAVVILVALCAAYLPARRAIQQDPVATLRAE